MKTSFNLEIEDEHGTINEYYITYEVSKYYSGDYYTAPEGGDLEIISIKQNGVEADLDEKTLNSIYEYVIKHEEDHGDDHHEQEED